MKLLAILKDDCLKTVDAVSVDTAHSWALGDMLAKAKPGDRIEFITPRPMPEPASEEA